MQIQKNVDGTVVTFLVADDANGSFTQRVLNDGTAWLREARRRLPEAITYSTKAMMRPDKVADTFWDCLHLYFGIPLPDLNRSNYGNEINTIIHKLQVTSIGLNGDVTIADLSSMDGVAGFLFRCTSDTATIKGTLGVVYCDPVESLSRYWGELVGKAASIGVTTDPRASPIYLNFPSLWEKGHWWGVISVIHEATHKFARTTDEMYFKGGADLAPMFQQATAELLPFLLARLEGYDTHDEMRKKARSIVKGKLGTTQKIEHTFSTEIRDIEKMPRDKALNNADGLARYAHTVATLPGDEELDRAIARELQKEEIRKARFRAERASK